MMAKRSLTEMVQLNLRVPRGHDAYWSIICQLDTMGPWDLKMIDDRCNVDLTTIRDFVRRLVRGGYAVKVGTRPQRGTGSSDANQFRLLQRPFEAPRLDRNGKPLDESVYDTLWRTMRMVKMFTIPELVSHASTDIRQVSTASAGGYLRELLAVGVIAPAAPKIKGEDQLYRLVNSLGPKAPSVMRSKLVFDHNSRAVLGSTPAVEVLP